MKLKFPKQITKSLNIIPVEWIDEVISSALVDEPTPISKKIKQQKNKKIEEIISNFNSNSKKFFNKVTFKNFVNDILAAYFG